MNKYFLLLLFVSISTNAADFTKLKSYVDTMQPGQWLQIPGTKIPLYSKAELDAIRAQRGGASIWGVTGSTSVIDVWNGAAFDGYRWWFTGGGHRDYGGNEVYEFNFETLEWSRLTEPAPLTRKKTPEVTCPDPETTPGAAHTYDGFTWNPVSKSIWKFRNGGYCYEYTGKVYNGNPRAFWEFKPDTKEWVEHRNPDIGKIDVGYVHSVWNPETQRIVVIPKQYTADAYGPFEVDENAQIHRRGNKQLGIATGNMEYNPNNKHGFYIDGNENTARGLNLINYNPLSWSYKIADMPQEAKDANLGEAGIAWNPSINGFVIWSGGREIWTFVPSTKKFEKVPNTASAAAPAMKHKRVFSKFVYIKELDVYAGYNNSSQGVWLYKLDDGSVPVPDVPRACVNSDCTYTSIQTAFNNLQDGDTGTILAGEWKEGAFITANNVTILANGAVLTQAVGGKGAIVTQGDNITIDGLECKHISVGDGNGVCVRGEGKNLTLKNMYIHDSQQGVMTNAASGVTVIEDSLIENNSKNSGEVGKQHGIYIAGDKLIVKRTTIRNNFKQGHELKSRAKETIIEDSIIASGTGVDSRTIDIPDGGKVTITNSILQHGTGSVNNDFIGYGHESTKWATDAFFTLSGNTIISDNTGKHVLFAKGAGMPDPVFSGNTIIGTYKSDTSEKYSNCYFDSRADAGLPVYPDLSFDRLSCAEPEPEPVPDECPAIESTCSCNCSCSNPM